MIESISDFLRYCGSVGRAPPWEDLVSTIKLTQKSSKTTQYLAHADVAQSVAHCLGKEKPSTKIIPKILIRCCGTVGSALPW